MRTTDTQTTTDSDPLPQQLRGRAAYLRTLGEVKSPELMERAANDLERNQDCSDFIDKALGFDGA